MLHIPLVGPPHQPQMMSECETVAAMKLARETEVKNGVFWDVMLCGSCKNRRFGGI
jgi:hypothetical protein